MRERKDHVVKKKLTLKLLAKRIAAIERRLNDVEGKAGHAYLHTMRIGGPR